MFSKLRNSPRFGIWLRWLGTILASALFVWLVARQRWDVVLQKAAGIPLWVIATMFVFYIVSYGFNTLRWCSLLWAQDVKITFWQAFRIGWAGSFASNFLFSTVGGDGLRMAGIFHYTERKSVAIGSVALDRIINMAAMACLIPLPVWMFGSSLGKLFTGAALALPTGLKKLVERYFPKVAEAFKVWASRPWAFVYAFLAAWPSNLFPIAAVYLLAAQLGIPVSFWQVLGVQAAAYFISQLPSINGYGLREATLTTLYAALGASLEQASTLALVARFISVLATIPGALWLSGSVFDAALHDPSAGSGQAPSAGSGSS